MGGIVNEQVEAPVVEERKYAGQFESPEALEKAYTELRSFEGRRNEELSQLRNIASEFQALKEQMFEEPQRRRDTESIEQTLLEQIDSEDPRDRLQAIAFLAQQVASAQVQQVQPAPQQYDPSMTAYVVNQMMGERHPDWRELSSDVRQVLIEKPHLIGQIDNAPIEQVLSNMDTAYEIAKARSILRNQGTASLDALAAAQAAKEAAQTMQGGGVHSTTLTPDQQAWEEIKNAKTRSW